MRAGIAPGVSVYEPTAGNGALLIGTGEGRAVTANELNEARLEQLRQNYPGAIVTGFDAMQDTLLPKQFAAVIANPPFGVVKDEQGNSTRFDLDNGYRTNEIDHAIAMKSLAKMRDDGRAVLIVGSINKLKTSEADRSSAYNGKAKREFYWNLYNEYNVIDHFTVDGALYAKQGASWPVDVIVIQGRGKSALSVPAVTPPSIIGSWAALETKLADADGSVSRPAGVESSNADENFAPRRVAPDNAGTVASGLGGRANDQAADAGPNGPRTVGDGPIDGNGRGRGADEAAGRGVAEKSEDVPKPGRDRERISSSVVLGLDGENNGQVPYVPASGKTSLETLVPANMALATDDALRDLTGRVGDIDAFVSDRLGYKPSEIGDYFSAEQIDALALAIDNIAVMRNNVSKTGMSVFALQFNCVCLAHHAASSKPCSRPTARCARKCPVAPAPAHSLPAPAHANRDRAG